MISAGGQISIGDGTQVLDNTATSDGKAAINLADGQTLYIGSGAILSGNTSNGVSGSVQAGQNTRLNVYTDATAYTFINDGISTTAAASTADAAPLAADQTVMTKTGAGTLVYGGTGTTDTFGGTYQQLEGNLIIGHATFGAVDSATGKVGPLQSIDGAVMGTDDTVYDIRTGQVTLAKNSTMKGASATFGGDSTLLLSDGSVLDFGTPATFQDNSRVGIQVSDASGNPVPLAQLRKGTESVTVTLNGTDISGRLLNNVFLSTTMAPGTAVGTTITPALTVAVAQDVSRMNPKSNVAGPLGTWNARGVNVGRTAFRLNAGIDVLFSNQWGARVCYQFETRNKLTAHGINGALSYTF